MGMYDEVIMECPSCGENHIEQTKRGECSLATYFISSPRLPLGILGELLDNQDNGFPIYCGHCGEVIILECQKIIHTTVRKEML